MHTIQNGTKDTTCQSYEELVKGGKIPEDLERLNPDLYEALRNGGVSNLIASNVTTFDKINTVFSENPEAVQATRYGRIISLLTEDKASLSQLASMPAEDLNTLILIANTGGTQLEMIKFVQDSSEIDHTPQGGITADTCQQTAMTIAPTPP
ncbi:MAG: hypothetical protein ACPGRX_04900 [Bdellovibrionales bacterium]